MKRKQISPRYFIYSNDYGTENQRIVWTVIRMSYFAVTILIAMWLFFINLSTATRRTIGDDHDSCCPVTTDRLYWDKSLTDCRSIDQSINQPAKRNSTHSLQMDYKNWQTNKLWLSAVSDLTNAIGRCCDNLQQNILAKVIEITTLRNTTHSLERTYNAATKHYSPYGLIAAGFSSASATKKKKKKIVESNHSNDVLKLNQATRRRHFLIGCVIRGRGSFVVVLFH